MAGETEGKPRKFLLKFLERGGQWFANRKPRFGEEVTQENRLTRTFGQQEKPSDGE